MMISIHLNWEKVFDPQNFDTTFLRNNGGIYIWIFKGTPHRVTYVGEASNFANRFATHFSNILTGRFNTYKMDEKDDFVKHLFCHYHKKSLEDIKAEGKCYIPSQPSKPDFSFKRTFFDKGLLEMHRNYLSKLVFAFAPWKECKEIKDAKIRKQVEGILIAGLRELYAKYVNVKLLRSEESLSYHIPIGNISRKPTKSFSISHSGNALPEIPRDIMKITGYDFERKKPKLVQKDPEPTFVSPGAIT